MPAFLFAFAVVFLGFLSFSSDSPFKSTGRRIVALLPLGFNSDIAATNPRGSAVSLIWDLGHASSSGVVFQREVVPGGLGVGITQKE